MNLRMAKMLRGVAAFNPTRDRTEYEPQQFYKRTLALLKGASLPYQVTKAMKVAKDTPRAMYRAMKRAVRL